MQRTLFVLVSDHGHTPIDWNKVLGIEDLKIAFAELNDTSGKAYHLEIPALVDESFLSRVHALFGIFSNGTISEGFECRGNLEWWRARVPRKTCRGAMEG